MGKAGGRANVHVVIPAYRAEQFIEQCLDRACRFDVTVLLGIDGCKGTLDKVSSIRHKYNNLRVFYYPENKGTYLTFNALIDHVPDQGILITFGADDGMREGMVEEMVKNLPCYSRHTGVMCITKEMWNTLGGFRPWRVHADTDFIHRLGMVYPVKKIAKLFHRGKHPNQLTRSKSTGLKSALRNEMRVLTRANLALEQPIIYFKPEKNVGEELWT